MTGTAHRPVDISDVVGSANASPRQRTAEEVRQKYGRPRATYRSQTMTDESSLSHVWMDECVCRLGGVMTENLNKLGERGQRLQTLNDKTEDMVNDAQSFATMAKQLAQQKSKRWWQF